MAKDTTSAGQAFDSATMQAVALFCAGNPRETMLDGRAAGEFALMVGLPVKTGAAALPEALSGPERT